MNDQIDPDEMRKLVLSFLEHKTMNETADYLGRGRAHKDMPQDALTEAWVEAFNAFADDHSQGRAMDDYKAELILRGVEPPYDRVLDRLNQLTAKIGDLEVNQEGREAFSRDFADFLNAKNKPSA